MQIKIEKWSPSALNLRLFWQVWWQCSDVDDDAADDAYVGRGVNRDVWFLRLSAVVVCRVGCQSQFFALITNVRRGLSNARNSILPSPVLWPMDGWIDGYIDDSTPGRPAGIISSCGGTVLIRYRVCEYMSTTCETKLQYP